MSRSLWRCRNRDCPVVHGAVLGQMTADHGLVLDPAVTTFRCYLDMRRVAVACPACGTEREYRGPMLISARRSRAAASTW